MKKFENHWLVSRHLHPRDSDVRPRVEGGAVTCRLESCVKAFSQPGCAHLYGLSPVWILHGMREGERESTSARPLTDQHLNRPPRGTRRGSPEGTSSGHRPNFCSLPMPHGSSWAPLRGREGWGPGSQGTVRPQPGSQGSSHSNHPSRTFRNVR